MRARPERPLVVVGAGAQGLTFALAAARAGRRVVVLERSFEVGGQARSFHYDGFTFDFGLHAFVTSEPALERLARETLGEDYSSFYPRAATRLEHGAFVEDASAWCFRERRRPLYDLVASPAEGWNCMIVSKPPRVIYPKRGGFGRLFERMAAELERLGGRVLLGRGVDAADFELRAGRLAAMRLAGRRTEVEGCYWSAGPGFFDAAPPPPGDFLVLFHFLVEGPAPVPYHWVRLHGADSPVLPGLVYYPARFCASNAPRGAHGVGAVVPVSLREAGGKLGAVLRWLGEEPAAFVPLVRDALAKRGVLEGVRVVGARTHRLSAVPPRPARDAEHPLLRAPNFWDAARWDAPDAGDSGVPLQMSAALRAAQAVLTGPAFAR